MTVGDGVMCTKVGANGIIKFVGLPAFSKSSVCIVILYMVFLNFEYIYFDIIYE